MAVAELVSNVAQWVVYWGCLVPVPSPKTLDLVFVLPFSLSRVLTLVFDDEHQSRALDLDCGT